MFPFNVTSENVTVLIDNEPYVINRTNGNYLPLREALKDHDWDQVRELATTANAVKAFTQGKVTIEGNQVMYNGQPLHGMIVDKIFEFMAEGFPFDHLLNFIEKVQANPSFRAREELFNFLEKTGMHIDADGNFLGYKAIRGDYKDFHTGTCDNSIGAVLEMPRRNVDDDSHNDCSHGFHVGSYEYASTFHSGSRLGHIMMLVKVNPADVVAVPQYDAGKLRTCKYEVVKHLVGGKLTSPIVDSNYDSVQSDNDDWNDDYDSDEDYFDEDEGVCDDPDCPCQGGKGW